MIGRLAFRYLLIFAVVLLALSAVAYLFVVKDYASIASPALATAEGASALKTAEARVALTILSFDVPLLMIVGAASFLLARTSIAPLLAAQERERRFAADAAHELRSPLATIATVAQAARSDAPAQTAGALDTITHAALDASAIVADLLTLARRPTEIVLQCEPVDLAMIVTRCAAEFEQRARERGIAIDLDAQSAIVNGDERRLIELTRNLLENALRHARAHIRLRSAAGERAARIEVEDDGSGVPDELRARIFERFFRSNEPPGEGSGLGLSIAQWIAHAHRGTLDVRAGSSRGALFTLSVPRLAR